MLLKDKIALVTGAARGRGAAHARHVAREGACVVLTDILDDLGKGVPEELRGTGADASYPRLDVRETSDWEKAVADVLKRYGRIDVLVNNAGVCELSDVESTTDEEWKCHPLRRSDLRR
ncbi:SDR family NAD(P)-dependent oxidoreductase [Streptomyces sp. NPDC093591]|uniref:SDR family NAD(P)-dependent oxidoreductase n=1 Tax=Streptomyces sp. NPDC093591 TaxID=3366044 RepID=UPI00381CD3FB